MGTSSASNSKKKRKAKPLSIAEKARREGYRPEDNIIKGERKPGEKIEDLPGIGLWRRTRPELFRDQPAADAD